MTSAEKILKKLAESGKLNKWDIQKKTKIRYPQVSENVSILEKKALIQRVGEKKTKNGLPSPIYGLTFKGIMSYLSVVELKQLPSTGNRGESKEELIKRYIKCRKELKEQLKTIREFLNNIGKDLDYQIFAQIEWLLNTYGTPALYIILESAKNQIANLPKFFKAHKKSQEVEEQHLIGLITTFKKIPSLQRKVVLQNFGKGNTQEKTIDILKDAKNKLDYLKQLMELSIKSENEYLRNSFSADFFEKLSYLRKNKNEKNESLAKLVDEILERKRKTVDPLERIAKTLRNGD